MYKVVNELIEKIDALIEFNMEFCTTLSQAQINSNIENFEEIKKLLGKIIV